MTSDNHHKPPQKLSPQRSIFEDFGGQKSLPVLTFCIFKQIPHTIVLDCYGHAGFCFQPLSGFTLTFWFFPPVLQFFHHGIRLFHLERNLTMLINPYKNHAPYGRLQKKFIDQTRASISADP
jgi:hypothetical protein